MKETTPAAMPPCFERWCQRFDDCFSTSAQKQGFRHDLSGLLGESQRKNITQMADNAVGVIYSRLHHFLTEATWEAHQVNDQRLKVMNQCYQTKIGKGFCLIVDDTGHRKSGNFTFGMGRQYLGEMGKVDNGLVAVTTHLYDGQKSVPLDVDIDRHASGLEQGKKDIKFRKKPEIAMALIARSLQRGYRPSLVLIDAGYGNNTQFLKQLEKRKLKYLGGVAKNRTILISKKSKSTAKLRLDELAKDLPSGVWEKISLPAQPEKTVWATTFEADVTSLQAYRTFAIVMNAPTWQQATKVDYLITNIRLENLTTEWVVSTYAQRKWVEVFYRDVKQWLGWKECQARSQKSLLRHFVLVFCAYTLILWQKLTGGLQRRWSKRPLKTFADALEAFRNAVSFRFYQWLTQHEDVFAAYKASFGLIWA